MLCAQRHQAPTGFATGFSHPGIKICELPLGITKDGNYRRIDPSRLSFSRSNHVSQGPTVAAQIGFPRSQPVDDRIEIYIAKVSCTGDGVEAIDNSHRAVDDDPHAPFAVGYFLGHDGASAVHSVPLSGQRSHVAVVGAHFAGAAHCLCHALINR